MALSLPVNLSDNLITEALIDRQKAIFARQNFLEDALADGVGNDKDWVGDYTTERESAEIRGSLVRGIVDTKTFDAIDIQNRSYSSAQYKFQDASLGGNYPINPTPQFTRYADIREKGLLTGRADVAIAEQPGTGAMSTESVGLGRYYNEAIEETSQLVHMRFGVPEFNSMTQFFTSFYNEDSARIARTGRGTDIFFTIGKVAGLVVNVLYWPLLAAHAIGAGLRFLFKKPATKFYYMKPTMPLYWNSVTVMTNQWAVYRGLYPAELAAASKVQSLEKPMKIDNEVMSALASAMPDIFDKAGGVDVSKAASRAGRMKRKLDEIMNDAMNGTEDWPGFVNAMNNVNMNDVKPGLGIAQLLKKWLASEAGDDKKAENIERSLRVSENGQPPPEPTSFGTFLMDEFNDASDWATFKVQYTGSVGESFSNTAVESDLASKLNQTSAKNKSAYFSFAGGNVTAGIGALAEGVSSFAKGVLDSFGASGLVSLAGSAFVDIPRHWEASSTQMPRSTYTMKLVSPYGNTISQLMNMYIPLFMILAAALPKSTGPQSHTWPFLVEIYDPGRAQTRMGMIDSLSVNRGITNLGFNKDHNAMGIEVTFTIVELSSVMSMPVSAGFDIDPKKGLFDEDNLYSDYMNILASVDLSNQIYLYNKMKLKTITRLRNYKSMFTTQTLAREIRNLPGVSALDVFFKGTTR